MSEKGSIEKKIEIKYARVSEGKRIPIEKRVYRVYRYTGKQGNTHEIEVYFGIRLSDVNGATFRPTNGRPVSVWLDTKDDQWMQDACRKFMDRLSDVGIQKLVGGKVEVRVIGYTDDASTRIEREPNPILKLKNVSVHVSGGPPVIDGWEFSRERHTTSFDLDAGDHLVMTRKYKYICCNCSKASIFSTDSQQLLEFYLGQATPVLDCSCSNK
jgi:hypothetical protein